MRRCALLCAALFVAISGCATTPREPTRSAAQLQDLGEKCLAAQETASALQYLTEAAQKKPNDPAIEYDLALAYDQRGLQDQAISHLQNALKIKPNYPEALNTIGSIYAKRGQFELARDALQKALDDPFYKTPQGAAFNLGRLYEQNGDIEKAMSYYQQAVKFDQQYGGAWLRIGRIQEQLRRSDEARHAYGNAVRASPTLAEAHLRFGILSYQAGDLEAALSSLSRVERMAPNSDMADEARKYLQKVNAALQKKTRSHASSYVPPGEIEVIPNEDLTPPQIKEEAPSSAGMKPARASQPAPADKEEAPVPKKGDGPAQEGIAKGPESQQSRYVVQIGSFVDREKAEEIKTRLEGKGYGAVVKTIKDKTLGQVFIIQLQPVNSESKASTLKTQLGGEIEGEPEIVKLK